MVLAAKIDEYGRGGWIAAMVLAFWVFWPLGLALLAFLLFSGRLRACGPNAAGRWHNMESRDGGWCGGGRGRWGRAPSSGNAAFDDYRAETLRRLEEEQQEFVEYLERLRRAKDKAEFDQFMAERRNRPAGPDAPQGPPFPG
ncbi:MAG TPA: DUF2852 domain-containing protein [Acetobacteraceae bacterium]|nr:DUF2852 domain-containing protein [Acetobacteraceae bacterium]